MRAFLLIYLSTISLLMVGSAHPIQTVSCPGPETIRNMGFDELDTLSLTACTSQDLILIMGAARFMATDTSEDLQLKAGICFSLIADDLQKRSKWEGFDPDQPEMAFLLKELEAQQYNLALRRPSDWAKLWHYTKEGRWNYIAHRFFDRDMHWYALGLISILCLFFIFRKKGKKTTA